MFQGIKCVVQGADHIQKNLICQDAAEYKVTEHYGVAVVADGHGSAKYVRSDIGSKTAVKAAIDTVDAFMADYGRFSESIRKNPDFIMRKMGEQFLARWTGAVEDYHDAHELTEEERGKLPKDMDESNIYTFYGSTVLLAVLAEDYCYGMLIGDGGFVVVDEDAGTRIPIEDKNSRANYTSSICSRNAIDALNCFFEEKKPVAMCVSTDGLIKSFATEEDFKEYHVLLAPMLMNLEKCQLSLGKNLNRRTVSGSGDDISISVVFGKERVAEIMDILKDRIEKKRAEKKEREAKAALERKRRQEEEEKRKQKELQESVERLELEQKKLRKMMEKKQSEEEALRRQLEGQLSASRQEQEEMRRHLESLKQQKKAAEKSLEKPVKKPAKRFTEKPSGIIVEDSEEDFSDDSLDKAMEKNMEKLESGLRTGMKFFKKTGDLTAAFCTNLMEDVFFDDSPFDDDDDDEDDGYTREMAVEEHLKRLIEEDSGRGKKE